jgi:hydroxymethylpyrimidine/phosphomethylpyrimidine kinase
MRTALTIGGSDSSGGAGIQADLRAFGALGVRAVSAITAITAQNAKGVLALEPVAADLVTSQIEAAAGDGAIHATKIGMLANAAIVEAVAAAIEELDLPLVVLDPVLASSSGHRLLDDEGVQTMLTELLGRVRVITPNIPEAEALSGVRIASLDNMMEAARRLQEAGARAVIVKGGHADFGLRIADRGLVVDLLLDGGVFHEFRTKRVKGRNVRGTGCSYASAVAAHLALGHTLPSAAKRAQRFVNVILKDDAAASAHRARTPRA